MRLLRGVAAVWCVVVVAGAAAGGVPTPALQRFLEWFDGVGGHAPHVTLATFDGMGTGVAATRGLTEGDTIIAVPMDSVICRDTLLSRASSASERQLMEEVDDDEVLVAMALVRERALGHASHWAPYVDVLPRHVPLALTFTDRQLAELQDDAQAASARRRAAALQSEYTAASGRLREVLVAGGVPEDDVDDVPAAEWYAWAVSLVHSRALTIHGKKYLVPLADMFNYSPHSEDRPPAAGAHFLKYHVLGRDMFSILTDRATAAGDQVFEDYGDNDNTLYLHHHGFVALDNPFDCVDVALPQLRAHDPLLSQKRRLQRNSPLGPDMRACLRPGEPVPRRVYDWLAVVHMKASGLAQCNAVMSGARDRKAVSQCLGASPDVDAGNRRLVKALKRQLKAFPTTAAADTRLLTASPSDGGIADGDDGRRVAVQFRLTRKRLLKALIAELEAPARRKAKQAKTDAAAAAAIPPPGGDSPAADGVAGVVQRFNAWFDAQQPPVALIRAVVAGDGMRLGVVATRDIAAEEPYLSVPVSAIMSTDSAFNCPHLGPVLKALRRQYSGGDAFHELLFHLVFEKFGLPALGKQSFFKSYLDYLPTADEMLFPVFYSHDELEELQASATKPTAVQYRQEIERKFKALAGVLDKYSAVLTPEVFTLDNYKWAHAVLDSRSIWWDRQRHLVPMLDLINCQEGPDPSRVHSTSLDTSGDNAVTLAPWAFKAGEPVYENYGQPNHIYFSYHGFTLDSNTHDCVVLPLSLAAATDSDAARASRHDALQRFGLPDAAEPCVTPHKPLLGLTPRDRKWVEVAFDTDADGVVAAVRVAAKAHARAYTTSVREDEDLLETGVVLSPRQRAAIRMRLSEKKLLHDVVHDVVAAAGGVNRRARTEL